MFRCYNFFSLFSRFFIPLPSLVFILKRSHSLSLSLYPLSFAILCALNFCPDEVCNGKREKVFIVCLLSFYALPQSQPKTRPLYGNMVFIVANKIILVEKSQRNLPTCCVLCQHVPTYVCVCVVVFFYSFIYS